MSPDEVVRGFLDEVWDRGGADAAGRWVGASYAVPGLGAGPDAVAANVRTFREAFPDLRLAVAELLVDGGRVAVWMRLSGTHLGSFRGHPPTGRAAAWDEVGFFDVRDGRVVRGRFLADVFGLRKALGVLPADLR